MTSDKLIDKRWRKTNLAAWYLQLAPFIRFIGVSGSLSFGTIRTNSDIDLFIIAKQGRIWTCFYFVRLLLYITGQLRVSTEKRAGKLCPNRFVTDQYLIINPQNQYLAGQYSQMIPIFDEKDCYGRFLKANSWMEKYGYKRPAAALNLVQSKTPNFIRQTGEIFLSGKLGNKLEKILRAYQLKRLNKEFPRLNQPDSTVIVNDQEIRLHFYHDRSF